MIDLEEHENQKPGARAGKRQYRRLFTGQSTNGIRRFLTTIKQVFDWLASEYGMAKGSADFGNVFQNQ